jgi:ribonuclease HII
MIESYDINDYLKDDKELQKAVIRELFKEITTQQGKIDAYKISENEANEIIAELKAYKDVNEDFKTAWEELKAENDRLKEEIKRYKNV